MKHFLQRTVPAIALSLGISGSAMAKNNTQEAIKACMFHTATDRALNNPLKDPHNTVQEIRGDYMGTMERFSEYSDDQLRQIKNEYSRNFGGITPAELRANTSNQELAQKVGVVIACRQAVQKYKDLNREDLEKISRNFQGNRGLSEEQEIDKSVANYILVQRKNDEFDRK